MRQQHETVQDKNQRHKDIARSLYILYNIYIYIIITFFCSSPMSSMFLFYNGPLWVACRHPCPASPEVVTAPWVASHLEQQNELGQQYQMSSGLDMFFGHHLTWTFSYNTHLESRTIRSHGIRWRLSEHNVDAKCKGMALRSPPSLPPVRAIFIQGLAGQERPSPWVQRNLLPLLFSSSQRLPFSFCGMQDVA